MNYAYPHLMVAGDTGALVDIPRGYSSEQWEDLQKRFVHAVYPRTRQRGDWALWLNGTYRLWPDQRKYNIHWCEELAGPRGMSFVLLALPDNTTAEIQNVKQHLRSNRDVVSISTVRVSKLIDIKA